MLNANICNAPTVGRKDDVLSGMEYASWELHICNLRVDASSQGEASGTSALLLIMERLRSFLIVPRSRLAMEG